MLPDTVLASLVTGLLTGGAAVATAIVTYRSQRESDEEASKRLYRQHAVREEYEAYRDLYLAFNNCIREYREPGKIVQADNYEERIAEPMVNLSQNLDVASVYLSESDEDVLRDRMMELREQREYIYTLALIADPEFNGNFETPDRLYDSDFEDLFSEVKSVLYSKINVRDRG